MSDENWKITNFITHEDQSISAEMRSTDGPSSKWVEGWNDCMDGLPKKSTFGMSTEEHNDYLEGYEAAESD